MIRSSKSVLIVVVGTKCGMAQRNVRAGARNRLVTIPKFPNHLPVATSNFLLATLKFTSNFFDPPLTQDFDPFGPVSTSEMRQNWHRAFYYGEMTWFCRQAS
jgi:hypothetical protein